MKLSEFVLTDVIGKNAIDVVYFADVTVTTESGALWWKRRHVERKKIRREHYVPFWYFVDTGEMCSGVQINDLERSYKAKEQLRNNRA